MTVFVIVYLAAPHGDPEAVAAAYAGTGWVSAPPAGLLRTELLTDSDDPARLALLSEWRDLESFRDWQFGPDHRVGGVTSPLRPFQDRSRGPHYVVYRRYGGSSDVQHGG